MHLETRSAHIARVTTAPNRVSMKQVVRNLTDVEDGFLLNRKFHIMDRDRKYTKEFRANLKIEGVTPVRCPVRAPNCNAFTERFVRSVKGECLDRMIIFGEASLRRSPKEYSSHYHTERNHQGGGNRLPEPVDMASSINDPIHRRERLGDMLSFLLQGSGQRICVLFFCNIRHQEPGKNQAPPCPGRPGFCEGLQWAVDPSSQRRFAGTATSISRGLSNTRPFMSVTYSSLPEICSRGL